MWRKREEIPICIQMSSDENYSAIQIFSFVYPRMLPKRDCLFWEHGDGDNIERIHDCKTVFLFFFGSYETCMMYIVVNGSKNRSFMQQKCNKVSFSASGIFFRCPLKSVSCFPAWFYVWSNEQLSRIIVDSTSGSFNSCPLLLEQWRIGLNKLPFSKPMLINNINCKAQTYSYFIDFIKINKHEHFTAVKIKKFKWFSVGMVAI